MVGCRCLQTKRVFEKEEREKAVGGECCLKELVKERWGSVSNLANEVGWSQSKTRRVVCEEQEPTLMEMRQLAKALGLESAEQITAAFHL